MSGFNTIPPNPFPPSTDEDGTQAAQIKHLQEDVSTLQGNVSTLSTTKANQATIAPSFSAETSYSVDDIVYYEGAAYRCTTAHTGAWDANDFAATTIAGEISDVKGDVSAVENDVSDLETTKANQITIAPTFSDSASYDVGDIVYYNGLSYRCTNAHTGAWDASDFAATTIAGELNGLNSNLSSITSIVKTVDKQPDTATEENIKRDILSIISVVHVPYCVNVRYTGADVMVVGTRMGINYASAIVIGINTLSYYNYYGGAWTVTALVS